MATNMYKRYDSKKTRRWPVASGTQPGTVVIHPVSNQIGITLTARGDSTIAANIPGVTGGTVPNGGKSMKANEATVAVDGSWILDVAGVAAGDTTAASGGGTPAGTAVYVTSGGAYTLTSTSNTKIGLVDAGVIVGTKTPVLLGVNY
jgi:hypothetical protein